MAAPLISRLLIDAQTEFARAIEHVPGPARGRAIGRLNTAAWVIAHTTELLDYWINVDSGGGDRDPWQAEWGEGQEALPEGDALPTSCDEAAESFARVAERATAYLECWDEADLREVGHEFDGSGWEGTTKGYLVARAVAHLFAHAGELSVIASLVLSEDRDLRLPGRLEASVVRTASGWRWQVDKKPPDATRLHVGFRPRGALSVSKATKKKEHKKTAKNPQQARAAFRAFNARLAFQPLAVLSADQPWNGEYDRPGELRLVAETPGGLRVALLDLNLNRNFSAEE
ncbi:MAG: DinB family protein [Planctomycetes bacterium]|nr:DinB family protein [Planctomycetota bacterium]